MDNAEFAEFVREELARIQKLIDDKNADYAGLADSAFANFHEEAEALGITVETVWHVWVYKHWTAVTSFCKRGSVRSEPIDGRLDDVIGYCLLLKGIIRERAIIDESSSFPASWVCINPTVHEPWVNQPSNLVCSAPGCGRARE